MRQSLRVKHRKSLIVTIWSLSKRWFYDKTWMDSFMNIQSFRSKVSIKQKLWRRRLSINKINLLWCFISVSLVWCEWTCWILFNVTLFDFYFDLLNIFSGSIDHNLCSWIRRRTHVWAFLVHIRLCSRAQVSIATFPQNPYGYNWRQQECGKQRWACSFYIRWLFTSMVVRLFFSPHYSRTWTFPFSLLTALYTRCYT